MVVIPYHSLTLRHTRMLHCPKTRTRKIINDGAMFIGVVSAHMPVLKSLGTAEPLCTYLPGIMIKALEARNYRSFLSAEDPSFFVFDLSFQSAACVVYIYNNINSKRPITSNIGIYFRVY